MLSSPVMPTSAPAHPSTNLTQAPFFFPLVSHVFFQHKRLFQLLESGHFYHELPCSTPTPSPEKSFSGGKLVQTFLSVGLEKMGWLQRDGGPQGPSCLTTASAFWVGEESNKMLLGTKISLLQSSINNSGTGTRQC